MAKTATALQKLKNPSRGGTLFIPNTEAASAALAALQQEGKDLPLSVLSELKKMQSSLAPRKTSGGGNKPTGDTADSVLNRLKQSEHAIILPPPLPGLPDPFAEETNNNDNNNKKEESVSSPNIFSDTPYLASTTDHPGVTAVPPKVSPPELLIDPSKLLTEVNGGTFDMDFITFMEEGNVLPNISTELPSQNWKVFYDETKNVKRLFYVYTDTKGEVRATWTHPGGSEKQREAEKSVLLWLNNYYNTQLKAKKTSVVSNTNSTTNNNAAEEALPAGWEERIDPRSGNKFYINHNTKETTWVCPQRQASLPASSSIRNSSISNNDALPSGWEMRTDPQSNRPFYVNHVTKQTTWVKPTNTENNNNNNNANSVTSNSSEWESRVDPRTGKTFYINHRTKQTSWEKPQGMSDNNNTAPAVSHPWEARVDPATGKTFYVNHETKQTSWTLPR
ncbi:WW domain containing protein, putative [Angomonas deanei]|uniref:WW domain containing protein, putative n=1 Tax=Angomonas deanei TaxID=59799 RepID=A0A7G2CLP6_9TRYP|nr:WW domain containing protein, putative [Angomonas deanei]